MNVLRSSFIYSFFTSISRVFGFLRDIFTEPYIVNWKLTRVGAVSAEIPGVTIPYEAFPGSIGVLPGIMEVNKYKTRFIRMGFY